MTASTSSPQSTAATTSLWPGRNSSYPKTDFSAARASASLAPFTKPNRPRCSAGRHGDRGAGHQSARAAVDDLLRPGAGEEPPDPRGEHDVSAVYRHAN